jgi:G2/mitotic-specific cyclin-B3
LRPAYKAFEESLALTFVSFQERTPPLIDDFRYICDGAYTKKELIAMEIKLFKTIDYELGMPLSYRFLRRYARVGY